MDSMASTEFRKRYASLTSPTFVTVNGRIVGQWVPMGSKASGHRAKGRVNDRIAEIDRLLHEMFVGSGTEN